MINPGSKRQRLFYYVLLFAALISPAFIKPAQQPGEIILHDEHLNFTPTEFYIADVIDDRNEDERKAIARLLPFDNIEGQRKAAPVDFQGGFAAIRRFFTNGIPQNVALRPIALHLKKFMVTENPNANGVPQGKAELMLSFDIKRGEESMHLVDYTGNANYTRSAGPPQDVEPTLRKMLGSSLDYFNNWINKQAGTDIRLAKTVKVSFSDYTETPEGDTVYYSVNRPLTWADFTGEIPNSRYAAEVSPIIGYNERTDVKSGVISLALEIKVSLPKSACWARAGSRDAYTLNHEQRHFDLAKIAAMHFIRKIKTEDLAVSNYDGPINVDYLDAYRQMDTLELKYDNETTHGLDRFAQEKWNERIDRELKELGVR